MTNIVMIQNNWPLQSFTKNLALNLIKKHNVYLFIDSKSLEFDIDVCNDLLNAGVRIVKLDFFKFKFLNLIFYHLYRILVRITPLVININHRFVRKVITKRIKLIEYIIAIEKEAMVIAGQISPKIPIFYYSLELYYDKDEASLEYNHIRKQEKKSLSRACALIIQDNFRAESFFLNNNIRNLPVVKLPVSLPVRRNTLDKQKDYYWHDKFSIPRESRVILYFGLLIKSNRGLEEFVKNFPLDSNSSLVLHGYGNESFLKILRKLAVGKRVFISTDFVAEDKIDLLIRSSDIGLCWYSSHDDNNKHTAFSSEKIALFLGNGIPILTNFSESYAELYTKFNCGAGDINPTNLLRSSVKILREYNKYSINAYEAFQYFYDYEKNIYSAEQSIQDVLLNINKN